jgi:tetratricopeptide (TPR) repeat protein
MIYSRLLYLVLFLLLAFLPANAAKSIDWQKRLEKGYYEMSIGNLEKASDIFVKQIKSYPTAGAPHTALGQVLKRQGKFQEAKNEFNKACEVDPSYAEGFYELGVMLEANKEYEAASNAFEKFTALAPNSPKKAGVIDRIRFCKEHI